jgi:hypothetical protein
METIRIYEKTYDVIETFDYHVLLQDADGKLFLIEYQNLGYTQVVKYDEDCESNVISLKGWASWPKRKKVKNLKAL